MKNTIEDRGAYIRSIWTSPPSSSDLLESIERIIAMNPDRKPLLSVYEFDEFEIEPLAARQMVERAGAAMDKFNPRNAVVVRNDLQFGMVRMVDVFAQKFGVQYLPFKSEAEALAWLLGKDDPH